MKLKVRCQDEKLNQLWRKSVIEKSDNPISALHVGQCVELYFGQGFNTNRVLEFRGFVDGNIVLMILPEERYGVEYLPFFEEVAHRGYLKEIPTKEEALKRAKQFDDEVEG